MLIKEIVKSPTMPLLSPTGEVGHVIDRRISFIGETASELTSFLANWLIRSRAWTGCSKCACATMLCSSMRVLFTNALRTYTRTLLYYDLFLAVRSAPSQLHCTYMILLVIYFTSWWYSYCGWHSYNALMCSVQQSSYVCMRIVIHTCYPNLPMKYSTITAISPAVIRGRRWSQQQTLAELSVSLPACDTCRDLGSMHVSLTDTCTN